MADSDFLASLADKLHAIKRRGLASQKAIAAATGVAQEDISKVMHGRKRRRTPNIDRLNNYADMLLGSEVKPAAIDDAVRQFLTFGTEDELIASIRLCAALVSRRPIAGE